MITFNILKLSPHILYSTSGIHYRLEIIVLIFIFSIYSTNIPIHVS